MLWNYDRRVVAVLALFILGSTGELTSWSSWQTTAAALFLIVSPVGAGSDLGLCLPNVLKSSNGPQSGSGVTVGNPRAMIMIGPTLATNLLSTSLIGLQVWWVVHFSTNSIAFFPQRESTGVNDACWLATSAEIAPLSRLKRSLRCWSNQALHIAVFGYAAAHFSPQNFPVLIRLGTDTLPDIDIPGITRSLVRCNKRLSSIYLGSYPNCAAQISCFS